MRPRSNEPMKAIAGIALAISIAAGLDTPREEARRRSEEAQIVHVLNRIAFGPRPTDIDAVRTMGVRRYIDAQLRPDRLADTGMAAHLAGLPSVGLSTREIIDRYEIPQIESRRERKQEAAGAGTGAGAPPMPDPIQQKANSVLLDLSEQKILRAVYSER